MEEQQKLLEQEMDSLKDEIKKEMEAKGTEELRAGIYIVRWTSILSNKFDSKKFKESFGELYSQFTKPISSRRFTIS